MKKTKYLPIKTRYILLMVGSLILVTGGTLYLLESRGKINLFTSNANSDSTDKETLEPTARPTNSIDYSPAKTEDNVVIPDKVPGGVPQIPENNELSATITSARRNTAETMYLIKAVVTGTDTGSCKATMTRGSKVFIASSSIGIVEGQYSCINLAIPLSDLNENGEWNLQLEVTDKVGATASTSIGVIL